MSLDMSLQMGLDTSLVRARGAALTEKPARLYMQRSLNTILFNALGAQSGFEACGGVAQLVRAAES